MRSITLRYRSPLLLGLILALFALLLVVLGLGPWAGLADVAAEPAPLGPEREDPRGWSKGVPAAAVTQALAPHTAVPVDLPAALARDITQRTALFYFSPTCPHCTAAMPEINALAKKDTGLKWIGVASGSATEEQLLAFEADYQPAFEIVIDTDRAFAAALGARSTPSLYIARPLLPGEDTVGLPPAEGMSRVGVDEAYAPFGRGAGGVLLLRADPSAPFKHFDGGYQGDTTCGVCHSEERLSMAITHHQAALWTLYRRERHTEEPCVKCHVTGMGAPGGFVMGDLGHPMAGVQCEACHGPGGPHDGQRQDAKTSCVGCHDKEHSVAFSVEKGLPHIDHFAANHMTEAQLHERLAAIEEGSAAKPLLAFPEGPTIGAASCKSCHKKQHKWAQKDPHAAAMGRLTHGEDAGRVECVRCHATPKAVGIGAARASAADFRVDEGVGCESCHGPGGAHAAAPTKDNIVGLGDSCPECVIEAICTSCHDQTWDPKWELKARMAAIPH